ncbi:MAG TPA: TRAP transporter small permease [Alphaproteobacteria bacterium]|nr:TRAP transporter small permease [Alphaproteobacteria bacterium]
MDLYIRSIKAVSRVCGVAAALLIALGVLVVCDVVVERYGLNRTTIWQTDFVTYCLIAATFIGSPYVLMTRGHVNVDVLPLHVGEKARYWLALFTTLLAMSFCVVMVVLSYLYWQEAWTENWRSDTVWRARLWIPYAAMPAGLFILTLQYAAELLCLVTGREPPFGLTKDRIHA